MNALYVMAIIVFLIQLVHVHHNCIMENLEQEIQNDLWSDLYD